MILVHRCASGACGKVPKQNVCPMRTIVTACLRSLVERVLLWMRVWENPLSLLRCSSSDEPSALIGRLRAHGASVMHAPALVASLSLSL